MNLRTTLFDLSGNVALVTGAGFGLGRAFAQGLADFGAEIICADRDLALAEETAGLIQSVQNKATALHVDVADAASVQAMADRLARIPGRVDVLINNAGIATAPRRVHELPVADWNRLIAINLTGVFHCSRAIIPLMLARGRGSIINIASIIGEVGQYPGFAMVNSSYAAAKAGVTGFTRQCAMEYAKDGIRVNAIAPGWHGGTRLSAEFRKDMTAEEIARFETTIAQGTPMGRRGKPEELQGLIVYLASDASSYLTGQLIVHDGGWTTT